jgi:hypothetical protein
MPLGRQAENQESQNQEKERYFEATKQGSRSVRQGPGTFKVRLSSMDGKVVDFP